MVAIHNVCSHLGSGSNRVGLGEVLKEVAQLNHALNGHGVVHRNADAGIGRVAGDVDDLDGGGLLDQFCLEASVTLNSEVDIDAAAESLLSLLHVVSFRVIKAGVKHIGLHVSLSIVVLEATLLVHVAHVQSRDVDSPHRRRVVVAAR